jgi:hypothetical protein
MTSGPGGPALGAVSGTEAGKVAVADESPVDGGTSEMAALVAAGSLEETVVAAEAGIGSFGGKDARFVLAAAGAVEGIADAGVEADATAVAAGAAEELESATGVPGMAAGSVTGSATG